MEMSALSEKKSHVDLNIPPKKRIRILTFIALLIGLLVVFFIIVNFLSPEKIEEKPFFKSSKPMVMAHQGGEKLVPSNTMIAFQQAASMGVDALEFDLHITKDGKLVAIHDPTVDRTTDSKGKVVEYTLAELKKMDAGYRFKNLGGEYNYRGKGAQIPTVEEIFQAFPNMKMNIEIKDTNPPEEIDEMVDTLWELIQKYHKEDDVLMASFDQKTNEKMRQISNGRLSISGGQQEATRYVILQKLRLVNLYSPGANALQLPVENKGLNLATPSLIKQAHRLGMEVHYWTIDDRKTMERLLEMGADGIITNRPDILIDVMKKKGY
jgi:glycerophosphoryl diester phosphodiesterase